jgi:hypothetical protein
MSRTSRARKLSAATHLTHQQAVQHLEQLGVSVHDEKEYVVFVETVISSTGGVQLKTCGCKRTFYAVPASANVACPRCSIREIEEDSLWDADAKSAVRAVLGAAEWDVSEKVVYLPDVDVRGDRAMTAVTSLDELLDHLREEAFQGYNQSAPRDDGEWVFPLPDDDLVNELLEPYLPQLTQLGWW